MLGKVSTWSFVVAIVFLDLRRNGHSGSDSLHNFL